MPSYTATVQLSGGTLSVTRPHPSADDVDAVIDDLIYTVRDADNGITSLGITIVTGDDRTPPEDLTENLTTPAPEPESPGPRSATGPLPS